MEMPVAGAATVTCHWKSRWIMPRAVCRTRAEMVDPWTNPSRSLRSHSTRMGAPAPDPLQGHRRARTGMNYKPGRCRRFLDRARPVPLRRGAGELARASAAPHPPDASSLIPEGQAIPARETILREDRPARCSWEVPAPRYSSADSSNESLAIRQATVHAWDRMTPGRAAGTAGRRALACGGGRAPAPRLERFGRSRSEFWPIES